jgi:hypothetical protein
MTQPAVGRDKARLTLDPNPSSVVQVIRRRMIMSKETYPLKVAGSDSWINAK